MKNRNRLLDQIFLQHLDRTLDEHLFSPGFSLKKLLRTAGVSRTDLHRKITRCAGMSITAYLRRVKLKKAAVLLVEHPEWNIGQVALESGFENQSYFSRRFREVFGCCPAAFREQQLVPEQMC